MPEIVREPQESPRARAKMSEFFSMVPPAHWDVSISFTNMPVRLLAYGRILYQPPGISFVFLKWQIANWLEGQAAEYETFQKILYRRQKPSAEELAALYAVLLRIPVDFVAEYSVTEHPGVGPALVIDYCFTDFAYKGRVMYIPSPTGPFDVQIVSYEGIEPEFSVYLIEALDCMDSCVQVRPPAQLLASILESMGALGA